MEIRLLGPLEARIDGRAVAIGAGKPRALLAVLALEAGEVVPADRLIEGLWPAGRAPASAPKQVQLYVSQLRKAGLPIVTQGRGYALDLDPDAVDALRFERLVAAGSGRDALALWRGDPLADFADEPFAAEAQRRLADLRDDAEEATIDADLDAGRHRELVPRLDELVASDPLRERFHAQRMLALYRSGRQAEALDAFHHARTVLMDEIGIEPGRELRDLHDRMLRQDPELDAQARTGRPTVASAGAPRLFVLTGLIILAIGAVVFGLTRGGEDALDAIAGNAVGLIDPTDGSILEQYAVGAEPGAIAAGGGAVWVANGQDGTVSRVERGDQQVTTVDVGGEPTALAFGEGSLWVADAGSRELLQVDPATNRVASRVPVGNTPNAVAVGGGAVWVASPVDDRLDRLDLGTGRAERITVAGGPTAVAVGAGAVWVAAEAAGRVSRLDLASGATVRAIATGGSPSALAADDDGVWSVDRGSGTLSRIDPDTNALADVVPVGGRPDAVATGEGRVWVGDVAGGRVLTVDPESGDVERSVDVGGAPAALTVTEGFVWAAAEPSPADRQGGTLRVQLDPFGCGCLDPAGYDAGTYPVLTAVYDGLTTYRRTGGSAGAVVVPNLAESLPEATEDGRAYVFRLRSGLRFSDGRPVTPADVQASLERTLRLAPDTRGPEFFAGIRGAAECTDRTCDLSDGLETNDADRTVTIRLTAPDPEFMHKLATPLAYVVPADSPVRIATEEPLPGTGPYRVAEIDIDRGGTLERNPAFASWSGDARPAGYPDVISWTIAPDPEPDVAAVRAGRVDVLPVNVFGPSLEAAEIRALGLREPGRVQTGSLPATDYFFLNTTVAPFDDVRMRRAFHMAVDRRRLVDVFGGEQAAVPTCQLIPPGVAGYEPTCPYTVDPQPGGAWLGPDLARARRLARSGRDEPVTLWGPRSEPLEGMARLGAATLRRIGLDARLRLLPEPDYFGYVLDPANRPQAGIFGWIANYLTPSSFFDGQLTCDRGVPAALNVSQICDPRLDGAVDRGLAGSLDAWTRADELVVESAPLAPVTNRRAVTLVSDRVGAIEQNPNLGPLLDQTWLR